MVPRVRRRGVFGQTSRLLGLRPHAHLTENPDKFGNLLRRDEQAVWLRSPQVALAECLRFAAERHGAEPLAARAKALIHACPSVNGADPPY